MSTVFEKAEFLWGRFGFNHFKRRMNETVKIVGSSKESYVVALESALVTDSSVIDTMDALSLEAHLMGTRQVEIFSVQTQSDKTALSLFLSGLQVSAKQSLLDRYPYPIVDKVLLSKIDGLHVLSSSSILLQNVEYQCVVLSSVSNKVVRSSASKYLNSNGQKLTRTGAEFFVEEKSYRQHFHTLLWNEESGTFIISADRTNGISVSDSRDELFRLRQYVKSKSSADIGDAKNVFDAIDPIYDSADGHITKLGILTAQNNAVRLKLGSNETCIKKDQYHSSGEDEGYVHGRFSVAKRWLNPVGNDVYLDICIELPGKPAQLDTGQPLTDFSIHKCARLEDIQFSLDIISPHAS